MELREPITIPREQLDAALLETPDAAAVFLIHAREGAPYLARTTLLRRRLRRLLGARAAPSRMLHLRDVAERVEYWLAGSSLESALVQFELARRYFPDGYAKVVKLRYPSYVKLLLKNRFPRTMVTTRLSSGGAHYGPFRTRDAAQRFESEVLGLFQLRRCEEDLEPAPDHPGCVYGEMNQCLRPCQEMVGVEGYAGEAERVRDFLATRGESLVLAIERARDRASESLDFEEAARQHKRLERVTQAMKTANELAAPLEELAGVAVLPSHAARAVELLFFWQGCWQGAERLTLVDEGEGAKPLDIRLRLLVESMPQKRAGWREQQEQTALLAKWFYSSYREGEWVECASPEKVPYRRLANAVARVAGSKAGSPA
jgi:excinuclease UvrABC nuclease subunit